MKIPQNLLVNNVKNKICNTVIYTKVHYSQKLISSKISESDGAK